MSLYTYSWQCVDCGECQPAESFLASGVDLRMHKEECPASIQRLRHLATPESSGTGEGM